MPVIPAVERLRQETCHEFKASLGGPHSETVSIKQKKFFSLNYFSLQNLIHLELPNNSGTDKLFCVDHKAGRN